MDKLPDLLTVTRIVGSFVILGMAMVGWRWGFVAGYLLLATTDLIDGPLARWLGQSSRVGAVLDSIADYLLSLSLIVAACLLSWNRIAPEWIWILAAIGCYFIALVFSLLKFRRFPSFHTYAAKVAHLLVAIGGLCLILEWSSWPLRLAAIGVIITNLENMLIIFLLKRPQTDIASAITLLRKNPVEGQV